MTDMLAYLREKNPALPLYCVTDAAFAPFGRVLGPAGEALRAALSARPIPASGNAYEASCPGLEAPEEVRALADAVFGGMDWQAGCCSGRGDTLNALEYHKCSEVNATTTGCVLLMALPEALRDGALDSRDVTGFYLPPDTVIEVWPRVLHFAPCRVTETGFNCLVILERGVNAPLPRKDPAARGEARLLWMRGKWLVCHPDSPQAAGGACAGISGANLQLRI